MNAHRRKAFGIILGVGVLGMITSLLFLRQQNHETIIQDPWLCSAPTYSHYKPIPDGQVIPVIRVMLQQADHELDQTRLRKLSIVEAEALTGRKLADHSDLTPYLVRGVTTGFGTERITVYSDGTNIAVFAGALGSEDHVRVWHKPFVLFLSAPPKDVYIDCGLAE